LNVHLASPTTGQLTSMHFYGWKKGLKTGMYYLRTRPAVAAIQFTVDQSVLKEAASQNTTAAANKKSAASKQVNGYHTSAAAPSVQVNGTNGTNGHSAPSDVLSPAPSSPAASPAPTSSVTTPAPSHAGPSTPRTAAEEAAARDPEFAAALARQKERELEEAKLMCSLENKEACMMCSG